MFVALTTVSQLPGFLFAMGVAQSLSYYIARRPEDGPALLTTWTLMLVPLTAVAIAISELLLPTIFSNDGQQAIDIGRWFMFSIVLVVGLELNYGLLLGTHDFLVYNVLRFAQPALTARRRFVVLWIAGRADRRERPDSGDRRLGRRDGAPAWRAASCAWGWGRSTLRLGLTSLWYGVRGQGSTVATNVTARLDVAMLPAFVTTANVGLYSVATNMSLIVHQLSNTFAGLVLPGRGQRPGARPDQGGRLAVGLAAGGRRCSPPCWRCSPGP